MCVIQWKVWHATHQSARPPDPHFPPQQYFEGAQDVWLCTLSPQTRAEATASVWKSTLMSSLSASDGRVLILVFAPWTVPSAWLCPWTPLQLPHTALCGLSARFQGQLQPWPPLTTQVYLGWGLSYWVIHIYITCACVCNCSIFPSSCKDTVRTEAHEQAHTGALSPCLSALSIVLPLLVKDEEAFCGLEIRSLSQHGWQTEEPRGRLDGSGLSARWEGCGPTCPGCLIGFGSGWKCVEGGHWEVKTSALGTV